MKTNVSVNDFRDAFRDYGRQDNFSYVGLGALYDYLVQYEDDCGSEIELDVIALCCEYTEYENLDEFHQDYNKENYETIDDIRNATSVIMIDDDSFIIQCF